MACRFLLSNLRPLREDGLVYDKLEAGVVHAILSSSGRQRVTMTILVSLGFHDFDGSEGFFVFGLLVRVKTRRRVDPSGPWSAT
jgi:hypothetical protein